MFGSPSGAFFDPAGALAGGGAIEEGWLIARLDPAADRTAVRVEHASGRGQRTPGRTRRRDAIVRLDSVEAIAGSGLAGDRYAEGRGTFSTTGRGYELTLVEEEVLDSVDLSWEEARRNIVTRGVALKLVGRRFVVGSVECVGRRLAEPCSHLEKLSRPGLLRPLVHRAGLRADIVVGGTITVGDTIAVAD